MGVWHDSRKLPVGTKIKFAKGHRLKNTKSFSVRASNNFFAVCTQPINCIKRKGGGKYEFEKTVLYTIIDWSNGIRGTENLVFGMGAETDEDCNEMLQRLTDGETEVSHRNQCELKIEKVIYPTKTDKE